VSALLATYMVLHVAKADAHVPWLRWPLVLAPLLAVPAGTLALVVCRGQPRGPVGTVPILPPAAAAVALGASCTSSLAFGILLSVQLTSADGRAEAPPPIPPAAWAHALCPLAAAIILRRFPRNCPPCRTSFVWSPRSHTGAGWQRLSSEESSSADTGAWESYATAGGRFGRPDNTVVGHPACAASRRHSAPAAWADTGGGGRSAPLEGMGVGLNSSESGGGARGRAAGPAPGSAHGAGLFLEPGAARAAAVAGLALCLFLASGGLVCAKMGGALEWDWQAVVAPAW
jgi:hypothetical protein